MVRLLLVSTIALWSHLSMAEDPNMLMAKIVSPGHKLRLDSIDILNDCWFSLKTSKDTEAGGGLALFNQIDDQGDLSSHLPKLGYLGVGGVDFLFKVKENKITVVAEKGGLEYSVGSKVEIKFEHNTDGPSTLSVECNPSH